MRIESSSYQRGRGGDRRENAASEPSTAEIADAEQSQSLTGSLRLRCSAVNHFGDLSASDWHRAQRLQQLATAAPSTAFASASVITSGGAMRTTFFASGPSR